VQTLHGVADKDVVVAFEGRILALSKAHGLLGRKNWESVGPRDVIEEIFSPLAFMTSGLPAFRLRATTFVCNRRRR
jgi:HWE histidine kinase